MEKIKKILHYKIYFVLFIPLITFAIDLIVSVNINNLDVLIPYLITISSLLISLWFSFIFITNQMFFNRFSVSLINRKRNKNKHNILVLLFFIITLIVLVLSNQFNLTKLTVSFLLILNIVYIYLDLYRICFKIDLKEYITKEINIVFDSIISSKDNKEYKANKNLIIKLYKESLLKKEIYIYEYIVDCLSNNFKKYIIDSNKPDLIEDNKNEFLEKELLLLFVHLIKYSNNTQNDKYILNKIFSLMDYTFKCEKVRLLNEFREMLVDIILVSEKDISILYEFLHIKFYFLIKDNVDKIDYTHCDELLKVSYKLYYNLNLYKGYSENIHTLKFNYLILELIIKEKNSLYADIFDKFKKYVLQALNKDNIIYINIILNSYYQFLTENFYKQEIKDYEDFLYDIVIYKNTYKSRLIIEAILNLIDKLNDEHDENKNNLKFEIAKRFLDFFDDIPPYFFPKINLEEKNNDKYKLLIDVCISKANHSALYYILENINNNFLSYKREEKPQQQKYLEFYLGILKKISVIENSETINIVVSLFVNCIRNLDKEKLISKDLGKTITAELTTIIRERFNYNNEFASLIVEFLNELGSYEYNYDFISKENRINLYYQLYVIGIDAIEKGQEIILQQVSNTLGWMLKRELEKYNVDLIKVLVNYTTDFYNLCTINNISERTIIFVGTLFITIGAFCEKDYKYFRFKKDMTEKINKDLDYLRKSKCLRLATSNYWKDVLGEKSDDMIKNYWKYLSKPTDRKDS